MDSEQENQDAAEGGSLRRRVRLRMRTPYGEWHGDIVPEEGAKAWMKDQEGKHPKCFQFDYVPESEVNLPLTHGGPANE